MMAVRERAVKVMAALERRLPCLDDFVGQSWSVWSERTTLTASDGCDGEEYSKNGKKSMETMTLRKEDMSIFGHFPGHDDFYLVVCGHCGQVVKPQAFEKHCERRHGPLVKLYAHLRSTPPPSQQQRPRHAHTSPSHGTSSSSWSSRNQHVASLKAHSPSTPPPFRHSKPSKDGAWHSPSNSAQSESAVFKQPTPIEPSRSPPPPTHRDPPWPHGGPSPNRPPSTERAQPQRGDTSKSIKKCDLDKHCAVLDPERKKVCTRLLTCNIHSVHQRRKVQGRSKNFDLLVAELKMSSKTRDRSGVVSENPASQSTSPEAPWDAPVPPLCRRPLTNSPAFRTPTSERAEEDKVNPEEGGATQMPSPLAQPHASGDESEGEGHDGPADWHSTPWHPKPAALCSFGSRSLGHGGFTFDRRLHHLRSAMSVMVENHLSAHLWKKIPQASDPPSQSCPASPSSVSQHSRKKSGSHVTSSLKPSSGSAHLQSSSTSKTYSHSENSQSKASGESGPSRPRNPVGRPSKRADAPVPRKRKSSFSDSDAASPDKNCVSHGTSRPLVSKAPPSHPPQTNGSLSPAAKPRLQPTSEPHWAFKRTHGPAHHSSPEAPPPRGEGLHSRAGGLDHKALGKKRKSSGSSPPSKPHRLPSSPHSGFYPWKESKGAGLSVGGDKKLGAQKPKLHH